ncbi:hypothetical protein DPEC_G00267570 [Dallia pectoralis]|uniref:Uncharacterized protein n=1 Tax=Dallia pectoralis TaxID=75939 RepID=A0ACC2FNN7_DALPE|nr:hypothetical protein DPEC_G00267570 [Dallia pectoralis]
MALLGLQPWSVDEADTWRKYNWLTDRLQDLWVGLRSTDGGTSTVLSSCQSGNPIMRLGNCTAIKGFLLLPKARPVPTVPCVWLPALGVSLNIAGTLDMVMKEKGGRTWHKEL